MCQMPLIITDDLTKLVPQIDQLVPQPVFTITEKAPTRAFSWLKAPTSAFTFKTLHNDVGSGKGGEGTK